ncbi:MAG: hypothetical protein N2589_03265 [bacterium]|nr:hypothetical protein [bacterium]
MKIVEVIFDIPIERSFQYLALDNINNFVRVCAPLGEKDRIGFVIETKEMKEKKTEFKWIKKVYDTQPLITDEIFKLSKIISRKYYTSIGQIIFYIIGNFPYKYEKNFQREKKEKSNFLFQNFKKEIFLFDNKEEKNKFYFQLISKTDGSLIFIFPEISILEDFYNQVIKKTDKRVLKYYGEIKKKERLNNYLETLNRSNLVILGTRISIFLPLSDLNLVVIDSYVEPSYREKKQPKYDSIEVAEERCKLRNIPMVLTSYSISVKEYFETKNKKAFLFDKRNFEKIPEILIIDKKWEEMDKKLDFLTKLSSSLIEETILKGNKVGIIHNRKGSAKTFKCENCGHVLRCKICNSYLVLIEKNKLICKYCKVVEDSEKKCSKCGSKKIIERIVGIEKIYTLLKNTYPDFKIQKITAEERKIEKDIDIFVGTNLMKNIVDKFNFGLIIFPHADSFLNIPEYNSEEIFFLIINEFIWRLQNKNSKIIIQTKNPNFEIFLSLKNKNFELFYENEIKTRETVDYPPFSEIILIEVPIKKSRTFEEKIKILNDIIRKSFSETLFYDRVKDKKGKEKIKIVLKVKEKNRPVFEEVMGLREKLDFKIEVNPLVF